ncbi:hypothetical protein AYO41_02805 [Verrucomicrobia bacterium SCGC AG-212-E04]|nr:hypothetical protein AYO41_02805 [Verrucomicrobia bacterium SCGC AG-212-E04]
MPFHLAQINIARCRAPLDSPVMRGFVERLDTVNALADASPGFIWRLQTDAGDATSIQAFDDPLIIVNLSVWSGLEPLRDYVYRSSHAEAFRQRGDWFEPAAGPHLACWWISAGTIPTVEEGKRRLDMLAARGPTADAFTFRSAFLSPPA